MQTKSRGDAVRPGGQRSHRYYVNPFDIGRRRFSITPCEGRGSVPIPGAYYPALFDIVTSWPPGVHTRRAVKGKKWGHSLRSHPPARRRGCNGGLPTGVLPAAHPRDKPCRARGDRRPVDRFRFEPGRWGGPASWTWRQPCAVPEPGLYSSL